MTDKRINKVSELKGAHLDQWVARALGVTGKNVMRSALFGNGRGHKQEWYEIEYPAYSTLWADGGPIIEREFIQVVPWFVPGPYNWSGYLQPPHEIEQFGETPLIAAMRAFVASKFGDEVSE
jgi:hypothetical protein